MKFLKVLLAIVIIVVAMVVIAGLVIDGKYNVERTATIDGCYGDVQSQITDFNNWQNWSPWLDKAKQAGQEVEFTYSEEQGAVGSFYTWESATDAIGSGKMEISEIAEGKLDFHLTFTSPMEAEADGHVSYSSGSDGVDVAWGMYGENSFIGKIFFSLMGQSDVLAGDFDKGLDLMKTHVEAMDQPEYAPEHQELAERHYIGHRIIYHPMAIYHSFDEATMDAEMELAIPVMGKPSDIEGFSTGTLENGEYLVGVFYGAYEEVAELWTNMEAYVGCNNIAVTGAPYELYVTDPSTEPDTSKWETRVIYPVVGGGEEDMAQE
jgi:effector-binding domain-containing protein